MQYSVLMSVYAKEKPEFLQEAMDSMWNQTEKTDDFVLVCDGPLTEALDAVIGAFQAEHSALHVIRLEKNGGLGKALSIGLQYCKNELIARMDSDDISRPDRCEKQLAVFKMLPEISICSGIIEEFTESTVQIESRRILPEKQNEIIAFSKKRNPFNHACAMYKKSAVEAVGGYRAFYYLEDYYLWIRMLQKGFIGYNLQEPILWVRIGPDMYKRRGGWKYAKSQKALFQYMYKSGFIGWGQYIKSTAIRSASSLMPNALRKRMFQTMLRKEQR